MIYTIASISEIVNFFLPFASIAGYILILLTKQKHKWACLISVVFWTGLGICFAISPLMTLVFPEFIYDPNIWGSVRSTAIILYLLLLVSYTIFNKDILFKVAYGLMLIIIIEYFYCLFFGTYCGP